MHDPTNRETLQQLRAEIQKLKGGPIRGPDWEAWYQRTSDFLSRLYGIESSELQDFHAIRFDPARLLQDAERSLPRFASSVGFSERSYYLDRLSEADEHLLTLLAPFT